MLAFRAKSGQLPIQSGICLLGMSMPAPNSSENTASVALSDAELSGRIQELRPALRGYILSILPHPDAAEDVVQETCLFLWERRGDFQPGTNFKAWAFKTGYFKALTHRRELQRNKVVTLSEDLLHRIAGAAEEQAEQIDERLVAMRACLADLRPEDLRLLQLKYVERRSLSEQARSLNAPPNRLQKAISRVRLALRHCIEHKLSLNP